MSRYFYSTTLSFGGDEPTAELELSVSYSVAWGSPESGRYGPPEDYDPGAGDVVEDIKILTVGGKPWPVSISYGYQAEAQDHAMLADKLLDEHEANMIVSAIEEEASRADAAADDRFERMRDEMIEDDRE